MQNREDIRQKGNDKELKKERHERGKNIIFRKRGLNMVSNRNIDPC
jgi:hypothetical protein